MRIIPRYHAINVYQKNAQPMAVATSALDELQVDPGGRAIVIEAEDYAGDTIVTMRQTLYRQAKQRGMLIRTFKDNEGNIYLHT
jgi:hypothetical protein